MLDPRDRKSWQGFMDLMQPPVGYRLSAALGTSFGLSIDALTAALLAMSETDGEGLAREPVAGVMAITRLRNKVRILVHPGTISGRLHAGSKRFVALLDRMIVEAQPTRGLFHPKVWVLRFAKVPGRPPSGPAEVGRVVVASRNLSTSTAFELGAIFEGSVTSQSEAISPFAVDLAAAIRTWMALGKDRIPEVIRDLSRFVRRLTFTAPHEASGALRLRWQGPRTPLVDLLPSQLKRIVVVSPFVQPGFVTELLDRTEQLQLVSTPEALDALDDATHRRLEGVRELQGTPVLYQVGGLGDPEEVYLDGLHAKLLLIEDDRRKSSTFVGSANATGPGWGFKTFTNFEAMVEMQPGIGIDRFVAGFLRETKAKVHPWVTEYDRTARVEPDREKEAERRMLAALRDLAKLELVLEYDLDRQVLRIRRVAAPAHDKADDLSFSIAPLLLTDRADIWKSVRSLAAGTTEFEEVSIDKVTAFVALRARNEDPPLERTRLMLARLDMSDAAYDRRDEAVRQDIMSTADPAAVLSALVRGLAHLRSGTTSGETPGHQQSSSVHRVLKEASLEGVLQAVAAEPGLVSEMRLLLAPIVGPEFSRFCDDLEAILRRLEKGRAR